MVLGHFIHAPDTGVLAEAYKATASVLAPGVEREPARHAAPVEMWIPSGLLSAFLAAEIYSVIRPALTGPGWKRGLKFGVIALVFAIVNALGYHGVFNLPGKIWIWWMVGAAVMYLAAGPVLGWIAEKLAPLKS